MLVCASEHEYYSNMSYITDAIAAHVHAHINIDTHMKICISGLEIVAIQLNEN